MLSLSGDKDAEVIEAFNSTSRYLDALLNIDSTYFDDMVTIRTSDKWSNFIWYRGSVSRFTVHLTISDGFVSSKVSDKCDDFYFDIENFPFFHGDIPRAPSYGAYISTVSVCWSVCSGCRL